MNKQTSNRSLGALGALALSVALANACGGRAATIDEGASTGAAGNPSVGAAAGVGAVGGRPGGGSGPGGAGASPNAGAPNAGAGNNCGSTACPAIKCGSGA
ncbi:MAG TPA: hypothetical protein VNW92_27025, partial [Polyangiaceae bacterium]|nr:hypothetical protein [Polyangiaceae bacterium]